MTKWICDLGVLLLHVCRHAAKEDSEVIAHWPAVVALQRRKGRASFDKTSMVSEGSLRDCVRGAKLQAKLNRLQAEFQEKQVQLTRELEDARGPAAAAEKQAAEAEAERATLAQAVEEEEARALQERNALKSEASTLVAQVRAVLCAPALKW